ncbi:hypothetical protein GCM10017673_21310 [Streptosporangium violaceochromogenes]|nr:hypothetical protein GCM10017673_21310 [Streptosporangium violaceochromogenes]
MPEFGFVAESKPSKTATTPPKRSWNGTTHVLSLAAEVDETVWRSVGGGTIRGRAGTRGRLIALSEGPTGGGYLICDWCGTGTLLMPRSAKTHTHLLRGTECTGPLRRRSLAHPYETDLLALDFDHLAMPLAAGTANWYSLLYAMLEGAAEKLELSRDDIGGTLYARPGNRIGLVMFDAVPGGAGSVLRVARALDGVVEAAYARVSTCDCGEETSCYGCLRSFRNQTHHEDLSRAAALDVLSPLTAAGGLVESRP